MTLFRLYDNIWMEAVATKTILVPGTGLVVAAVEAVEAEEAAEGVLLEVAADRLHGVGAAEGGAGVQATRAERLNPIMVRRRLAG